MRISECGMKAPDIPKFEFEFFFSMNCPTCKKETRFEGNPFRPFCSERCKMIDLGKWAGGQFRIPTSERPPAETHKSNGSSEDED